METLGQAGRVGAMVIVGLVLAFIMYMFLSGVAQRHTYTLDVLFSDATGAVNGVPVTLAGVQIGQVENIHLTPSQKADLKMEIKDKFRIPVGSTFSIVTPILGSTGAVVVTPPANPGSIREATIQPGAGDLVGKQSADINTAFSRADTLLSQLSETTKRSDRLIDALTSTAVSAKQVIGGQQVQKALDNLTTASNNGVVLTQQLSHTITSDNEQLRDILEQTRHGTGIALDNIDSTTGQIQGLAAQNRGKLNSIVDDLQTTTASLTRITTAINASMAQGNVPQNLGVIVQNMKTSSDNLVIISNNFAKLSSDEGIQGDLRATLHNLRETTDESATLLLRLNGLVGGKKRTGDADANLPTPAGGVPPRRDEHQLIAPILLPRIDFEQNLRKPHFRADIDAILPIRGAAPGAFGRVGIYGAGGSNRGILEYGQALDPKGLFDIRGGIYDSKLSVGADVGLGRRLTLSLDAWDPNRPYLNATGVIMLGDGLGLLLSDQDILRQTNPTIGLEYRR